MLLVMKKSMTAKLKSLIYPLAFILIVILSAVYKLVFKGNGDFPVLAFKSGRTETVSASSVEATAPSDAEASHTETSASASAVETSLTISVYICGEVHEPGIYEAPKGVLLNEIIEDAGGLTEAASVNNINFVYRINSNMSIYIPSITEIKNGFSGGDIIRQDGVYVWGNTAGTSPEPGESIKLMVNINTAGVDELKSLPGVGEVTAKAIADYRKKSPFKTIEDIKNVTGIGDSKFNRIKDYICV